MTEDRTIKPVRGWVERRDNKISVNLEFDSDADAEAAFAGMARAMREGSLNIIAGVPPVSSAQEPRG
ncbi:hypothetical protein [Bosea sp. MMO-172]|uniref:hypothetical protein n=1 Tax=Bosea sp. MMO-172 TaxID=3127885 RepID=UPI00301AE5B4